jgi:hypothetical protein
MSPTELKALDRCVSRLLPMLSLPETSARRLEIGGLRKAILVIYSGQLQSYVSQARVESFYVVHPKAEDQ